MTTLSILQWPDNRLRTECRLVQDFDKVLATLTRDMLDTMYAANGRGLAAPQVGVLKRLFVMDVTWKTGASTPMICINPTLAPISAEQSLGEEQCLSIPDRVVSVRRFDQVQLRWASLDGTVQSAALDGAAARIAQHELDHLDGRLILDIMDHVA